MNFLQFFAVSFSLLSFALLGGLNQRRDHLISVFMVSMGFVFIALTFPRTSFADFDGYIKYVKAYSVVGYTDLPWGEFFPIALLKLAFSLSGDAATAVVYAAAVTFVLTMVGFACVTTQFSLSAANSVLALAFFGPLFAFVLLRGSLAYILVAIVVLRGLRWDLKDVFLLLLAFGFHTSSLLCLPVFLLYEMMTFVSRRFRNFHRLVFIWGVLGALVLRVNAGAVRNLLGELFSLFPVISGYAGRVSYFSQDLPARSVFHDIFLSLVCLLGLFITLIEGRGFSRKYSVLYVAFFLMFGLLGVNPVVAYRFSLFFLFPMLLQLDFSKTPFFSFSRSVRSLLLAGICIVVFAYSFSSVLVRF